MKNKRKINYFDTLRKKMSMGENVSDRLITMAAKKIDNKVDLENPDKIVRIEILGNLCGISFLKQDDIIKTPLNNRFIQS